MKRFISVSLIIGVAVMILVSGCGDDGPINPTNTDPTASFVVMPDSGTTETTFEFDASGCSDGEDAVTSLQVRWDWENDGTWDVDWTTTKTADHQYGTTGTKTVKLEVKDTGGLTDSTTRTVTITNTAPTASFIVTPDLGRAGSTIFEFDASGCSDGEDAVTSLQVRWDWENDGTWDTGWSTMKTTNQLYWTAGTKMIALEVIDTGGLTDQATRQILVTPPFPSPQETVGSTTRGRWRWKDRHAPLRTASASGLKRISYSRAILM